jgi:hypothetical protein
LCHITDHDVTRGTKGITNTTILSKTEMTSKDIVSTMRSKIIVATIIQSNCNNVMEDSTEDMKGPRRFFPYGKAKRTANSLSSYRVIFDHQNCREGSTIFPFGSKHHRLCTIICVRCT